MNACATCNKELVFIQMPGPQSHYLRFDNEEVCESCFRKESKEMKYKIGDVLNYTEAMRAVLTEGCFIRGNTSPISKFGKLKRTWTVSDNKLKVFNGIENDFVLADDNALPSQMFGDFKIVPDPRIKVEPEKSLTYQEAFDLINTEKKAVKIHIPDCDFAPVSSYDATWLLMIDLAERKGYRMTGK